jgi:ribosomal protein L11 methyltransferase
MSDSTLYYIEIDTPGFLVESVANRILDLGIAGAMIRDEIEPAVVSTYVEGESKARHYASELADYLECLRELFPGQVSGEVRLTGAGAKDWANEWKKWFKPLEVTARLVVKPTWEEFNPAPGQHVIEIDPQMAFGTGGHETTRLCIEELDRLADQDLLGEQRVLDWGTGTGILAIAAAFLGANRVLGVDTDSIAIETARENAELNGVSGTCDFSDRPLSELPREFSTIVANINSETLCQHAKQLAGLHLPGGRLILCGIVTRRAQEVRKAYENAGYEQFASRKMGEWSVLRAVRSGK